MLNVPPILSNIIILYTVGNVLTTDTCILMSLVHFALFADCITWIRQYDFTNSTYSSNGVIIWILTATRENPFAYCTKNCYDSNYNEWYNNHNNKNEPPTEVACFKASAFTPNIAVFKSFTGIAGVTGVAGVAHVTLLSNWGRFCR